MIKGIFFDLGQTLIYPPTATDLYQLLKEEGVEIAFERVDRATWMADKTFFTQYPFTLKERVEQFFPQYIEVLLQFLELKLPGVELAKKMYKRYPPRNRWLLYGDTLPVLRELREREYYLGVITNWILLGETSWDKSAREVIEEVGIRDYMDMIVVSTEEGVMKPEASIFHIALQRGGLKSSEVLYVGDSYKEDIVGAREAGLTPVLINHHKEWKKDREWDCQVINSLWQLLPLLEG